mgnify:FL=1
MAAQDGLMIKSLSFVHYKKLTPSPAVVLQGIVTFVFIVAGDIVQLIEFVSFLIWIFYGLAFVSLLVLRKTMKDVHRPYKVIKSNTRVWFYYKNTNNCQCRSCNQKVSTCEI